MKPGRQAEIRLGRLERRGRDLMRQIARRLLGVPYTPATSGGPQGQGVPRMRTGRLRDEELDYRVEVFWDERRHGFGFTGELRPVDDPNAKGKFWWLNHYYPFQSQIEQEFREEFQKLLNRQPPPESAPGTAVTLLRRGVGMGLLAAMAHPAVAPALRVAMVDMKLRIRGRTPYRGAPVAARIGQQAFEPMRRRRLRA